MIKQPEDYKKLEAAFRELVRAVEVNGKLVAYKSDILDKAKAVLAEFDGEAFTPPPFRIEGTRK